MTVTPTRPAHQPRDVLPARRGHGRRPMALAAAVAAVLAAGGSAGTAGTATDQSKGSRSASASPAAARRAPRPSPSVIAVPPPPAYLHQTMAVPSAHTRVFSAEMTDLWAAVVAGRPAFAVDAFFPLTAYQQVKAIADPTTYWHNRLFCDFRLDVAAAHQLLRPAARKAKLVQVIVPSAQARCILPGVCANGVGYWHVAGARVVYRQHGQLRSVRIASLISWRGPGCVGRHSPVGCTAPRGGLGPPPP